MYSSIKRLVRKLFPGLLKRNEDFIRRILALAYRGTTYKCSVCSYSLSKFISLDRGDLLCPRCGSLGRSRRLWTLLEPQKESKKVLHFSPPTCMKTRLEKWVHFDYLSSDYEDEFEADLHLDITAMSLPSSSLDLIICYHVLEHIPNDIQAMKELYRVLKPSGSIYIQTPFSSDAFLEDLSITSPQRRLELYGQADHVRIYTVDELARRLESVGFKIDLLEFQEEKDNRFGFKEEETVLLVKK